jgi:transketolase
MMSGSKPQRVAFGQGLLELADEYPNLVVLDADVSSSTQTKLFGDQYPERFFNFGIAEGNMVSAAAGMAACGLIPVAATFAFLMALRAGDAVRSLVAYGELNVKLVGGYAGLSDYADGASHQAVTDLALMRALPNLTVLAPTDLTECEQAVKAMLEHQGPVYLRLSREATPRLYGPEHPFAIGKGAVVRPGDDLSIMATGVTMEMSLAAADMLAERGVSARVVSLPCLKPLDQDLVIACAQETGAIVTVEEHNIIGGLGSAVCQTVCGRYPVPVKTCGVPDCFGQSGPYAEILAEVGLDPESIVQWSLQALQAKAAA